MQPESLEEAQDWLERAELDVLATERLLDGPQILGAPAIIHAQQAAEKALKAFLSAHERIFAKTHNLVLLLDMCQDIDHDFARFRNSARTLNPYVIQFRYPGSAIAPSEDEAREADRLAREIVQFVRERLAAIQPPSDSSQ